MQWVRNPRKFNGGDEKGIQPYFAPEIKQTLWPGDLAHGPMIWSVQTEAKKSVSDDGFSNRNLYSSFRCQTGATSMVYKWKYQHLNKLNAPAARRGLEDVRAQSCESGSQKMFNNGGKTGIQPQFALVHWPILNICHALTAWTKFPC